MKKILIDRGLSTGIRLEFDIVHTIEIDDKPFAIGGFGEVYNCISINGNAPSLKQVVKIFIDNSKGSAEHSFKTTQRLQKKANKFNENLLKQTSKTLFEEFPAFQGMPQYSFEGNISGKPIMGFTSDNLVALGFTDFEHFLENGLLLSSYQIFPIERKMLIAYQLVSAFKVLEDFSFIHADLKPGALFINLKTAEIAIIDYDSGVITEDQNDEPACWGAANDWVAPEIWEQQANIQRGEKINVDIYSDRWSVAIGVHYLMTTFHPLFYLVELSPRVAKQYFTPPNQWPVINKNAPYFQKANEVIYDQYFLWVNSVLPKNIRDRISQTINFGYKNPVARTSYNDWKIALKSIQQNPKINYFYSDKSVLVKGLVANLIWDVEGAHTVEIDNGVGVVEQNGRIEIKPDKDLKYKVTAIGYFGQAFDQLDIRVFPTPVLESLKVPIPDFSSKLNLHNIRVSSPKIDVSIKLTGFNQDKIVLTKISTKLDKLKLPKKIKQKSFIISNLYERIRRALYRRENN